MLPPDKTRAHRLRLQRAWTHIEEFRAIVKKWSDSEPFTIITEHYPEQTLYLLKAQIRMPLPLELSVIAGDAIHNMRAVLDNLISDLVPKSFRGSASFPILSWGDHNTLLAQPGIAQLDDSIIAYLHTIQPYNVPDRKSRRRLFLFMLNQLWNLDKHRQLSFFTLTTGLFRVAYGGEMEVQLFNGRVYDGKVIGRIITNESKPKFEPSGAIDIAFDGGPAHKLLAEFVLVSCHNTVRQILSNILPDFNPMASVEP